VGQKAPQGPASHPLGIETDVGRQKSAALIFWSFFIKKKGRHAASNKNKPFILFRIPALQISQCNKSRTKKHKNLTMFILQKRINRWTSQKERTRIKDKCHYPGYNYSAG
jgi:hypothetical protein